MSRCEPSIQALSSRPRRLSLGSSSQSVQYIHLWAETGQHHIGHLCDQQPPCGPNSRVLSQRPSQESPCPAQPWPTHLIHSFIHSTIQQIFDECLLQVGHSLAVGDPAETKAAKAPALLELKSNQEKDKKQVNSQEGHTHQRVIKARKDTKQVMSWRVTGQQVGRPL